MSSAMIKLHGVVFLNLLVLLRQKLKCNVSNTETIQTEVETGAAGVSLSTGLTEATLQKSLDTNLLLICQVISLARMCSA